jgi:proton glutamate symport protein
MKLPSLSVRIGLGLLAGLGFGLIASATGTAWMISAATGVEPVGQIWMNAVRMCVVPLVATALISGVGSIGDMRTLGRVGVRTFAFMGVTVLLSGLFGLLLGLFTVRLAPVSPEAAATLRDAAAAAAGEVAAQTQRIQGFRQFVLDLIPTNPVKAAADGALLSLVVFSLLFGAAAGSLPEQPRRTILGVSDAAVAALIKLVGWVMEVAPAGVMCLAAPVAARFGWEALRSLAVFIVTVVAAVILAAAFVYAPAARFLARVRPGPFARAITPGCAVAFTTASSMAALPTMMDSALNKLRISTTVSSFVLPLGATLNRPGSSIYQIVAVIFIASLYGVPLGPVQLTAAVFTSLLMTFSVASIPSATVFTTAPVLMAAGLPVEGIALLLGVDRIPDMFRTALNAIGHQVGAAVIARGEGEELA